MSRRDRRVRLRAYAADRLSGRCPVMVSNFALRRFSRRKFTSAVRPRWRRYSAPPAMTVTPDELVSQTYLPGRRGSLQLELIAAARRHQRIPYVLDPDAAALFAELDAGHPVLVLQDLGVGPLHVWHYAVVIGYEAEPAADGVAIGHYRAARRCRMPTSSDRGASRSSGRWSFSPPIRCRRRRSPVATSSRSYPSKQLGDTSSRPATAYATALTSLAGQSACVVWPGDHASTDSAS